MVGGLKERMFGYLSLVMVVVVVVVSRAVGLVGQVSRMMSLLMLYVVLAQRDAVQDLVVQVVVSLTRPSSDHYPGSLSVYALDPAAAHS